LVCSKEGETNSSKKMEYVSSQKKASTFPPKKARSIFSTA
jgi:hypothetical protein